MIATSLVIASWMVMCLTEQGRNAEYYWIMSRLYMK